MKFNILCEYSFFSCRYDVYKYNFRHNIYTNIISDRISNVTSSFVEDSNWHESSTYRLVFGPLCVDLTSSLIHRLSKLMFSAQDYDYPCYAPYSKCRN